MKSTSRLQFCAAIVAVLAACGGESKHHAAGGAEASGGSDSVAGSTATGGTGAGATGGSSTGGSISIGGKGGGAGAIAVSDLPQCLQPADAGTCKAAIARYAFDPQAVACKPFTYGGCAGNDNNFETLDACNAACVAPLPSGCDSAPRATGCPCTADATCTGLCAIPGVSGDRCAPAYAGYCEGVSERCSCRIDGQLVCGA